MAEGRERGSRLIGGIVGHLPVTVITRHPQRERHRRALSIKRQQRGERQRRKARAFGPRPAPGAVASAPGVIVPALSSRGLDCRRRLEKPEAATRGRKEAGPAQGEETPALDRRGERQRPPPRPERRSPGPSGREEEGRSAGQKTARLARLSLAVGRLDRDGGAVAPVCGARDGRARGRHERRAAAPRAR